jgi:hypothetical protein
LIPVSALVNSGFVLVPRRHHAKMRAYLDQIHNEGFAIVPAVLSERAADVILHGLSRALDTADEDTASIRSRSGGVYAARNILALWPEAAVAWRHAPVPEMLAEVLGRRYGLVRALFFDKPPEQTWALPWHKDLTIAVRDNRIPSEQFRKPTTKAGVPHVEASCQVLETMLTVRLHLESHAGERADACIARLSSYRQRNGARSGRFSRPRHSKRPRRRATYPTVGGAQQRRLMSRHSSPSPRAASGVCCF